MIEKLTPPKYFLISLFLIAGLALNIFNFKFLILGLILGLFYLIFYGFILGNILLPQERFNWQLFYGNLALISLISLIGTIIYYFYQFNQAVFTILLLLVPIITFILFKIKEDKIQSPKIKKDKSAFENKIIFSVLTLIYLITLSIGFYLLFRAQSGEAIRSPWWLVSSDFFIVYFIASLVLFSIIFFNKKTIWSLFLISLHITLTLSVALIVYKIGYGFDPFIHQATERQILEKGVILPKPFYYLGQYILVIFLAKLSNISVVWIDKLLILILTVIYLPSIIYYNFKKCFLNEPRTFIPLGLTFFILPFNYFIVTTPQSLANLFLILTILISLVYFKTQNKSWLTYLIILTLTTLAIHPLSGIPLLIFIILLVFLITISKTQGWLEVLRKIVVLEIIILSSIAIPLIFILNSFISGNLSSTINLENLINTEKLISEFKIIIPYFKNHFRLIYDLIYWYGFNIKFITIFLALLGFILLTFKKSEEDKSFISKIIFIYPLTFLILLVNYLFLKISITFPSLIEYERLNYPQRVLEISLYFLLPFFLYFFWTIFRKMKNYPIILNLAIILFLSSAVTISIYFSYPRDDDYHTDRGYNITQSDINTVRFIDKDAQSDYIVLANQITSVAAIKEFGFKKYYPALDGSSRQYFYYPIPTGDPLYKFYEEMVYQKANRDTVLKAMDLVGVNSAYFVINKYWWKFEPIVEQAKQSADFWQIIDSGEVYVFKYVR